MGIEHLYLSLLGLRRRATTDPISLARANFIQGNLCSAPYNLSLHLATQFVLAAVIC
jgi:hypothetical protein